MRNGHPLPISVLFLAFLFLFQRLAANEGLLAASPTAADFMLADAGKVAPLVLDAASDKRLERAAMDLSSDIERVTGARAEVLPVSSGLPTQCLIVGISGQSALLDRLSASGTADFGRLKGLWESYEIRVVEKPMPGVERALVVAGSDVRGAIYGLYEISSAIGVSPWYWWADVPVKKKNRLAIAAGARRFGPPSVKYRGIFLNDEDWGLQKWAAKTHEPELGDIGPKTYARIFELLLRLKANTLWPAMHACTQAFNNYPQNRVLADEYGIVMGSSHCEPLLRNNVTEWKGKDEDFDFTKNEEAIRGYWEKRLIENGRYENLYTLGIRGIHDSAMRGPKTPEERVRWLERVFEAQRELLAARVSETVASIPQIFCPYKEVLADFKNGLRVPAYATVVVPDDNFGYLRYLPSSEERARQQGGFGAYYHISYLGRPLSYLWLNTTPPALVWEEMSKAYENGVRQFWMLNVGDLKPAEIGIDFFLQMAWDIERWNKDNLALFTRTWAAGAFGGEHAEAVGDLLDRYYHLGFARRPEHLQWHLPGEAEKPSAYSSANYGDEMQIRLDAYASLREDAEKLADSLPEELRDAFYELAGYPALGSALANERYFLGEKARLYVRQGRVFAAQRAAEMAAQADSRLQAATDYYNLKVADGKWKGILSLEPADGQWKSMRIGRWEPVSLPSFPAKPALGVSIEGSDSVVGAEGAELPPFEQGSMPRFVDVFNRGTQKDSWTARVSAPWIRLSKSAGELRDDRILVEVDESARSTEALHGTMEIEGAGEKRIVSVTLAPKLPGEAAGMSFVEREGVVAMNAGHFDRSEAKGGAQWTSVSGLGRTGAAVTVLPSNVASVSLDRSKNSAPALTYGFFATRGGPATLLCELLPTFSVRYGSELRFAVSLDGGEPVLVEAANEAGTKQWSQAVLENCVKARLDLGSVKPGRHELKILMLDPGVALDRLTIDFGGLRPSYLGAPETRLR